MLIQNSSNRRNVVMRRRMVVLGIVAVLGGVPQVYALEPLLGDEPVQWRQGVIALNDVRTEVRRVAGRAPDRAVTLYAGDRIPVGEQWMFIGDESDDPQVLWVEFTHGRVSRVWVERRAD